MVLGDVVRGWLPPGFSVLGPRMSSFTSGQEEHWGDFLRDYPPPIYSQASSQMGTPSWLAVPTFAR